jgi:DNA recombination protein RmuC
MNVLILVLTIVMVVLLGAVIQLLLALLRRPAPLAREDLPQTLSPESLDGAERRLAEQLAQRLTALELKEDAIARAQREELNGALNVRFKESSQLLEMHLKEVRDRLLAMGHITDGVQRLSESVMRFNRLLGNVKARGTWGEVQLERLLADMFVQGQYAKNVKPNPRSNKIVEFALALPGAEEGKTVWLPVDSKFPVEDYERLLAATTAEEAASARKSLNTALKLFATQVSEYIQPPHTTDFAVMFLPTEGLFLEAASDGAFVDELQRKHVLLAGPQTLAALFNALQMGFKTLAVQKQSAKAWDLMVKVKRRLDDCLADYDAAMKKLEEAGSKVNSARDRVNSLTRDLRNVTIPEEETPHA